MRFAHKIAVVGRANNHRRQDPPAVDACTLPKGGAILADCNGSMIYKRRVTMAPSFLFKVQRAVPELALGQWESEA